MIAVIIIQFFQLIAVLLAEAIHIVITIVFLQLWVAAIVID
jgi:hypothetical protein